MEPNKKIESNQETQERIDAYLMGKLDEAALADFETQMRLFPDFRANVNEQRILLKSVEEYILKGYNELKDLSTEELIAKRMDKYSKMGEFKE